MDRSKIKNEEKTCNCEIGNLKGLSKNVLRYSICDACSEKLFSKNKIRKRSLNQTLEVM